MLLICQNATVRVYEAWIKRYNVLCSKTYSTFDVMSWSPAGSLRAARGTRICETRLLHRNVTYTRIHILNQMWN